jgi:hypothetical protein
MGLFLLCYLVAAMRYPGGSWTDPGQVGFSWRHNYLCDLLDTRAVNGALNTGRYWARTALGLLCAGLFLLWHQLPKLTRGRAWQQQLLRYSGLAALGTTVFLSSGTHDLTVRIAGAFGLIGMVFLVAGLWRAGRRALSIFGIWSLGIFVVNYAIYETGSYLGLLPLIQKITFVSFLAWFAWMDMALLRLESGAGGIMAGT